MIEFYPDIYDYLESIQNSKSVSAKGLEDIAHRVRAHTGLDYDVSLDIVKHFFQEIRNVMLRGDMVSLTGLGKFYISSPRSSNNIKQIFPKFEPYKQLIDKLNENESAE